MTKASKPTEPYAPNSDVALGYSFSLQVTDRLALVMQAHIPAGCADEQLSSALDKVDRALTRQQAKHDLRSHRRQLELQKTQMRRCFEDMQRVQTTAEANWQRPGRKGAFHLSNQEAVAKQTAEVTLKRFAEEVEAIEKLIADCEEKVRGNGAPSATDS